MVKALGRCDKPDYSEILDGQFEVLDRQGAHPDVAQTAWN